VLEAPAGGSDAVAAAVSWRDLLRAATVAIEAETGGGIQAPLRGTGFLIAPDIVVTCAHVVAPNVRALPSVVRGEFVATACRVNLLPAADRYFPSLDDLDLALLHVETGDSPEDRQPLPFLPLLGTVEVGDRLWAYGHPEGRFRAGQSARLVYEGPGRLIGLSGNPERHGVQGSPVDPGFSGSAVVNERTGAVCGMLQEADGWGGAHLLSADDIVAHCRQAQLLCLSPVAHAAWLHTLTDEQLRHGGWPFPGPRLRRYLKAAARVAQAHPYPGVLPGNAAGWRSRRCSPRRRTGRSNRSGSAPTRASWSASGGAGPTFPGRCAGLPIPAISTRPCSSPN
jgi:GTP diphosphokinase / guanosine-3',5'-bis(diphosphate) 3'-diphosphatase